MRINLLYKLGAYALIGSGLVFGGDKYVKYKEDAVRAEVAAKEQAIRKEVTDKEYQYREEAKQKEEMIRQEVKQKEVELRNLLETCLKVYQRDQQENKKLAERVEALERELERLKAQLNNNQEVKLNRAKAQKN